MVLHQLGRTVSIPRFKCCQNERPFLGCAVDNIGVVVGDKTNHLDLCAQAIE